MSGFPSIGISLRPVMKGAIFYFVEKKPLDKSLVISAAILERKVNRLNTANDLTQMKLERWMMVMIKLITGDPQKHFKL